MAKQHGEKIGAYLEENENIWNISRLKLKSAINQYFNQLWVEQTPLYIKAGIYKLFKIKVGIEDYQVDITSRRHRVTYTTFRLSDHSLVIEEGRRKGLKFPEIERIWCYFLITIFCWTEFDTSVTPKKRYSYKYSKYFSVISNNQLVLINYQHIIYLTLVDK